MLPVFCHNFVQTYDFFDTLKTKAILPISMAKQEIRTVNGNRYLYYTHYEDGERLIVYCGPATHTKSKIKGTKLELEHIASSIKRLEKKHKRLQDTITRLRQSDARSKARSAKPKSKSASDRAKTRQTKAGSTRKSESSAARTQKIKTKKPQSRHAKNVRSR